MLTGQTSQLALDDVTNSRHLRRQPLAGARQARTEQSWPVGRAGARKMAGNTEPLGRFGYFRGGGEFRAGLTESVCHLGFSANGAREATEFSYQHAE